MNEAEEEFALIIPVELFGGFSVFGGYYVFPARDRHPTSSYCMEHFLPEYSETDFGTYSEWLLRLDRFIRNKRLSLRSVLIHLKDIVSAESKPSIELLLHRTDITNFDELRCELVKNTFDPSVVNESLLLLLRGSYPENNSDEAIIVFVLRINQLMIACLSFDYPVFITKMCLGEILLSILPSDEVAIFKSKMQHLIFANICDVLDEIFEERIIMNLEKHPYRQLAARKPAFKIVRKVDAEPNEPYCTCCGCRGHIKKHCVFVKDKCAYCSIQGHLLRVCKSLFFRREDYFAEYRFRRNRRRMNRST